MKGFRSIKPGKMTACIIGAVMLFVVLFSAFYVAREADHECSGEACPICACIARCEQTLQRIGAGAAVQPLVWLPVLFLILTSLLAEAPRCAGTPVSQKTRMNN